MERDREKGEGKKKKRVGEERKRERRREKASLHMGLSQFFALHIRAFLEKRGRADLRRTHTATKRERERERRRQSFPDRIELFSNARISYHASIFQHRQSQERMRVCHMSAPVSGLCHRSVGPPCSLPDFKIHKGELPLCPQWIEEYLTFASA